MQRTLGAGLLALTVAASAVAGCGSSDALTRSELVMRANRACRVALARTRAEDPQSFLASAAGARAELVERLDALTPPEQTAARYDQLLSLLRQEQRRFDDLAAMARTGNARDAVAQLEATVMPLHRRVSALARGMGLDACA